MRTLLVAALALSSNVALSQSRTITQEHIGCKREEISDRLTKFAVQGDQEAFKKLLITAMVAGECVRWEKGKQVFVEKSGGRCPAFDRLVKFNATGHPSKQLDKSHQALRSSI